VGRAVGVLRESNGVRWESAGSPLGVRWESAGSPLGVRWESAGSLLGFHEIWTLKAKTFKYRQNNNLSCTKSSHELSTDLYKSSQANSPKTLHLSLPIPGNFVDIYLFKLENGQNYHGINDDENTIYFIPMYGEGEKCTTT
jgi:hypothetical protein